MSRCCVWALGALSSHPGGTVTAQQADFTHLVDRAAGGCCVRVEAQSYSCGVRGLRQRLCNGNKRCSHLQMDINSRVSRRKEGVP